VRLTVSNPDRDMLGYKNGSFKLSVIFSIKQSPLKFFLFLSFFEVFNLDRTCWGGDRKFEVSRKKCPKKYIFPCSVCYYFLHRISNPDRDLLCWKGNFLSKIEVNVPPQSIARPTRDKFDVETF